MVDDSQYIQVIKDTPRPAVLIEDIVAATGVSDTTARKNLRRLAGEGKVEMGRANGGENGRLIFWLER